ERPISPASATQRAGAASVPRIRTRVAVTGTVSASGTPPGVALASSERWKSTRKAAQHAPHRVQGSSRIVRLVDRAAALLVLLAAAAGAGIVAAGGGGRRRDRRVGRERLRRGQVEVAPVREDVVDRIADRLEP